jgi:uncharacterized protein YlxW (UPF0749 family)
VRASRRQVWHALVAVAALVAGFLFASSANTARGTDLRARGRRLPELIVAQQRRVAELDATAARLRREIDAATDAVSRGDARVAELERANDALAGPVGLTPLKGPGLHVTLDDAPRLAPGEQRPGNPHPDALVVHEQDVLAVINAMWAGGADAVSVMGDRIVATSSVRCVGNTLLLHGKVYSPPFVVEAIGDPRALQRALDESPGVQSFLSFVAAYDVGFTVADVPEISVRGYDGPLVLGAARAVE